MPTSTYPQSAPVTGVNGCTGESSPPSPVALASPAGAPNVSLNVMDGGGFGVCPLSILRSPRIPSRCGGPGPRSTRSCSPMVSGIIKGVAVEWTDPGPEVGRVAHGHDAAVSGPRR